MMTRLVPAQVASALAAYLIQPHPALSIHSLVEVASHHQISSKLTYLVAMIPSLFQHPVMSLMTQWIDSLRVISIGRNNFTGNIISAIPQNCQNLDTFWIANNKFYGNYFDDDTNGNGIPNFLDKEDKISNQD